MILRTRPFDGGRIGSPFHPSSRTFSGNGELTFLGNAFERLDRAFDPVLAVIAVGRKQPDHLIGAARGRTCDIAGRKIDSLTNVVFMLQRPLHHAKNVGPAHGPACVGRLKNSGCIAWGRSSWPVHQHMEMGLFCRFLSRINANLPVSDESNGGCSEPGPFTARSGRTKQGFLEKPGLPRPPGGRMALRSATPRPNRADAEATGGDRSIDLQAVCGSLPSGLA